MKQTGSQLSALVILRVLIGWHFLYEGLVKLLNPDWSAYGYLISSEGIFSGVFQSMATNESLLSVINVLNQWGLFLIGLGLFLGVLTRLSCYLGALLLLFYYLAHPPFVGVDYAIPTQGNYLLVDKNLIEMFTLIVISLFPTGVFVGLDRILFKKKKLTYIEPIENNV